MEKRGVISQERRDALGADLRVIEVDNLAEIQANYHQFAEAVKPILKQGAAKLIERGIFPEENVAIDSDREADITSIKILDVSYEGEGNLSRVVVDPEGKMYVCKQTEAGRGLGWVIDWASRREAKDKDYVDFSFRALSTIADEFREALGMDTQSNPIPYHSRL